MASGSPVFSTCICFLYIVAIGTTTSIATTTPTPSTTQSTRSSPRSQLIVGTSKFSAATPGFNYTGYSRFPAFYFGADETGTGVQSPEELAFVARHALAGWGWQQGSASGKHGEAQGQAAAARLRAVAPRTRNATSPDALFVYRQSESLFTLYDLMAAVAANTTLAVSAELHDPVNSSQVCGGGGLLGFGEEPFLSYWVNVVGGEIAREACVDAVFYDGFDKLYSGDTLANQGCPGFSQPNFTAHALKDKVAATAQQTEVLNAQNSFPIISTYNYFAPPSSSSPSPSVSVSVSVSQTNSKSEATAGSMNGVTEDLYAHALAGKVWMRFYEVWLGHGDEQDSDQIDNAIRETAMGIPFVVRSDPRYLPHQSVEYAACAFLIAQGPYCYFGVSTGWLDSEWSWHGEYSWKVGKPLAQPVRSSQFVFTRRFENANITVDTTAGHCNLVMRD